MRQPFLRIWKNISISHRPVPLDQFDGRLQRLDRSVRQQPPFHRGGPRRSVFFARHQAANLNLPAAAVGNRNPLGPETLLHAAGLLSLARRHCEANAAQGLARGHRRPQLAAVGQRPVVLGANQPVGGVSQVTRVRHQRDDVGLAISHIHQTRLGQAGGQLGHAAVPLGPARALQHTVPPALFVLGLARPHPGVQHPQRLPIRRDRIGRMQVHAPLGFVGQRPQAGNALTLEVQFRRVLKTQHDRMGAHAHFGALPVRREHGFPFDIVLAQKPIRRLGFRPATAGLRDAGRRVGRHAFSQQHRPLVQATVAKVDVLELLRCPAVHVSSTCV